MTHSARCDLAIALALACLVGWAIWLAVDEWRRA